MCKNDIMIGVHVGDCVRPYLRDLRCYGTVLVVCGIEFTSLRSGEECRQD